MALKKKSTFFCFLGEFATFLGKNAYFLKYVTKCNVATTIALIGCKLFEKTFFMKKKIFFGDFGAFTRQKSAKKA